MEQLETNLIDIEESKPTEEQSLHNVSFLSNGDDELEIDGVSDLCTIANASPKCTNRRLLFDEADEDDLLGSSKQTTDLLIDFDDFLEPSLRSSLEKPIKAFIPPSTSCESFVNYTFDDYGFLTKEGEIGQQESPRTLSARETKEASLERIWKRQLQNWPSALSEEIKLLVGEGIPHNLRSIVWKKLCQMNISALRSSFPKNYYERLVQQKDKTKSTRQIALDLDRTFSNHRLYMDELDSPSGKQHLVNVLRAYSFHNAEVGYCQGMSYVAATLLMNFPQHPEDAFWIFLTMLENKLDRYYTPHMTGLIDDSARFAKILERKLPHLASHLADHGIDSLLYLTPWWMCMFTNLSVWTTTLRIWDLYFLENTTALFRMALAILHVCQDDLIRLDGIDRLLPYLLSLPASKVAPDVLFPVALSYDMESILSEEKTTHTLTTSTTTRASPRRALSPLSPVSNINKRNKSRNSGSGKRRKSIQSSASKPSKSLLGRFIDSISSPRKKTTVITTATVESSFDVLESSASPSKALSPTRKRKSQAPSQSDKKIKSFEDKENIINSPPSLINSKPSDVLKRLSHTSVDSAMIMTERQTNAFREFSSPSKMRRPYEKEPEKERLDVLSPEGAIKPVELDLIVGKRRSNSFLLD